MDLKEANEIYTSQRLPQVPDTLVTGGGVPSVTFKEPVSSTPCLKLHPLTVDLSGSPAVEHLTGRQRMS